MGLQKLSPILICTISVPLSLLLTSCSLEELEIGSSPSALEIDTLSLSKTVYSTEVWSSNLKFLVTESKLNPLSTLELKAYSDSLCTQAAPGLLSLTSNPVNILAGSAEFQGLSYTLPSALEETIYFQAASPDNSTRLCSGSTSVLHKFSSGNGYVNFGDTGGAGGTGANLDDLANGISVDHLGRYFLAGPSKNSAGRYQATVYRFYPNGTPDRSFSPTGAVTFGETGAAGGTTANLNDWVNESFIDAQGNYVLTGYSNDTLGKKHAAIWRFKPDGSIDLTFNGTGATASNLTTGAAGGTAANLDDITTGAAQDPSGKYVLAGRSKNASGKYEVAVWRFNTDGTPDLSFNSVGSATSGLTGASGGTGANLDEYASSMLIDSQGRYLVAGRSKDPAGYLRLALWRFTSLGLLDTSFGGGDGMVATGDTSAAGGTGTNLQDIAMDMRLNPEEQIVVIGYSKNNSAKQQMAMWRFNSDGSPDLSFGGTGSYTFGATGAAGGTGANLSDLGLSVEIDDDGRYVAVGRSKNAAGGTAMALWRVLPDGTADTSFSPNGAISFGDVGAAGATGASVLDTPSYLMIDSFGRYLIAGRSTNASGRFNMTIWRYLPNGQLDK